MQGVVFKPGLKLKHIPVLLTNPKILQHMTISVKSYVYQQTVKMTVGKLCGTGTNQTNTKDTYRKGDQLY